MMVTLELWITIIAVRNPNDWRHLELNERETKKKKKKRRGRGDKLPLEENCGIFMSSRLI